MRAARACVRTCRFAGARADGRVGGRAGRRAGEQAYGRACVWAYVRACVWVCVCFLALRLCYVITKLYYVMCTFVDIFKLAYQSSRSIRIYLRIKVSCLTRLDPSPSATISRQPVNILLNRGL